MIQSKGNIKSLSNGLEMLRTDIAEKKDGILTLDSGVTSGTNCFEKMKLGIAIWKWMCYNRDVELKGDLKNE